MFFMLGEFCRSVELTGENTGEQMRFEQIIPISDMMGF
jgi:hypothetical protein